MKLVELAMVQIVGNVENERCFFMLAFMKSKLYNKLTTHLPLVAHTLHWHINFTCAKISHMQNALTSGEEHDTNIALMAR